MKIEGVHEWARRGGAVRGPREMPCGVVRGVRKKEVQGRGVGRVRGSAGQVSTQARGSLRLPPCTRHEAHSTRTPHSTHRICTLRGTRRAPPHHRCERASVRPSMSTSGPSFEHSIACCRLTRPRRMGRRLQRRLQLVLRRNALEVVARLKNAAGTEAYQ